MTLPVEKMKLSDKELKLHENVPEGTKVRGFFNKSCGSMPQTPLPALGTYRTGIHAFCESKHSH